MSVFKSKKEMQENLNKNNISLPSTKDVLEELERETKKRRQKRIIKNSLYGLVVVASVTVLVATLLISVMRIVGISMEPTLFEGEIVAVAKNAKVDRGDIYAFSYSNKVLIKRVVGIPGDKVLIDENGNLYINDHYVEEPYIDEKSLGDCDIEFPYYVPENQYFVMGDRRETSVDSRNSVIGCVTKDQLVGELIFKIWPSFGSL